ncbi:unnamed protein product [Candidula unifasciata]|uniref:Exosome complex component RRP46 n=1 Tax=Candidula unifasciata TaxID=100452 RepID=A0A8S3YBH3_9EUPU|nr:unnamed protein product [Candidula unifasciata]
MAAFTVVKKEDLEAQQKEESVQSLRCITSELGPLTQPDGSAVFTQGDTTALAAVYGPADVKISKELIDRATVEVIYKPKVGLPRPVDRKLERIIKNTLEAAIMALNHPRSLISIVIQETESLGANLACCVNAACMALLDAAVSMNFMVAAVSAAVTDKGEIILDPVSRVEDEARAVLTFVFDSVDKNIVTVITSGQFSQDEYKKCLYLTKQACDNVFSFYKDSLSKKLLKSA